MGDRRFGDRKDASLVRDLDGMHFITPIIYPNRCDNEAYISEQIDLSAVNEYLIRKNADDPQYKYNLFQVVVAALLKTVRLRPKMNRFVANRTLYHRNYISAAFVVKKIFSDEGGEALAFIYADDGDTIDSIHEKIYRIVSSCRSDKKDASSDAMDMFLKMPRFLGKAIVSFICWLDRHGWVPQSLIDSDPYYSSVVLTNLGSIKLHSGYHHLTNWGTNSLFVVVGERRKRPFYDDRGNVTMKDSVDLGLTVDERIADGYYFSKTVKLFKYLLEHPDLLELPLDREVDY